MNRLGERETEQRFNDAIQKLDEGAVDESVDILRDLLGRCQNRKPVVGTLALVLLYLKEDPQAALPLLRESTSISPKSEKASVGLFHALISTGDFEGAKAESQRFLAENRSDEYERILSEITWS